MLHSLLHLIYIELFSNGKIHLRILKYTYICRSTLHSRTQALDFENYTIIFDKLINKFIVFHNLNLMYYLLQKQQIMSVSSGFWHGEFPIKLKL